MFDTRNLSDHAAIRAWVEERGGRPAVNEGLSQHDDASKLRLMFGDAGETGEGTAERFVPIDWDDWFARFDRENLALWVQDRNADGEVSRYYQITVREAYEDAHETGAPDLDRLREAKVPHKDPPG